MVYTFHPPLRAAIAAAFALAGCSSADEALTPRLCAADEFRTCACPDGTEGEQACLESGAFGACSCLPEELLVTGVTRPGFVVDVLVPDRVIRAVSDERGRYVVELTDLPTDALIVLRSRAPAGDAAVELLSVLDTFDELRQRGGDGTVDEEEHRGTDLGGFSTIRAAALRDANGGRLPATRRELVAAEGRMDQTLRATTLIEAGLLLERFGRDLSVPPAFETTWTLATDLRAVQREVRRRQPVSLDPSGPLARAAAALVETSTVFAAFDPLGHEYLGGLRRRRQDGIGRAADRYIFDEPQRARYQPSTADANIARERRLNWTHTDSGVRISDSLSPFTPVRLSPDEVVRILDRPDLEADVRAALGNATLRVERRLAATTYRQIGEGIRVMWLARIEEWVWGLNVALRPYDIDVEPVTRAELAGGELWHRVDAFEPTEVGTPVLVERPWAMRILAPAARPAIQNTYGTGDPIFAPAILDFRGDGRGTASRGALTEPLDFEWTALPDRRIRIDFDDGRSQTSALVEDSGRETGWLHAHGLGPSARLSYGRDVEVDANLSVTADQLVNEPGTHWQSTFTWDAHDFDDEGRLQPTEVSGFRFAPDGTAERLQYVKTTGRVQVVRDYIEYTASDDEILIETFYGSNGFVGRCTVDDGSCVPLRSRRWVPIALREGYLYVIESRTLLAERSALIGGQIRWNADEQQWQDALGRPLATELKVDLIPPRLNAYRLRSTP